jgi:hypothetical protein
LHFASIPNKFNRVKTTILLLLLFALPCFAQTNVLWGTITPFASGLRTNLAIELDIVSPLNRVVNGQLISNDAVWAYTDTNGYFAFTNVYWGTYQALLHDSQGSHYPVYVGTNTLGTLPLTACIKSAAAMPPNPGTNYYTQAQIDALLSNFSPGGEQLWTTAGTTIYPNGNSGESGGWTGNENTIYPQ